jgi:hypothetical protein
MTVNSPYPDHVLNEVVHELERVARERVVPAIVGGGSEAFRWQID